MSRLYGPVHRSLQDRFETRRLADNVETRVVLTEIPQEHKAFIESRDAQMPDLYIEGVAGRRRRTDSYPKHVDQADRRLEVITRGVSESGSAHHATWLLDRSIAEANEREYRKEASCLADARHTLVYKQLLKKSPARGRASLTKILRLRVVNASRVTIPY
jgi:hypothetical protein